MACARAHPLLVRRKAVLPRRPVQATCFYLRRVSERPCALPSSYATASQSSTRVAGSIRNSSYNRSMRTRCASASSNQSCSGLGSSLSFMRCE